MSQSHGDRLTERVDNERVTVRMPAKLLADVEAFVEDRDGYGRCDFIRDAVDEHLEVDGDV